MTAPWIRPQRRHWVDGGHEFKAADAEHTVPACPSRPVERARGRRS
jgi:hypothetical protein